MVSPGTAASAANAVKLTLGKLQECLPRKEFEELISHAFHKQNGVSLKYMLDFGSNPIKRQLVHSAQFLTPRITYTLGTSSCRVRKFTVRPW
eukprot:jgi/Botrbrau1/7152/Bobra.0143s0025.1